MNHQILAYLIYLPITYLITVRVGWICYKNGAVFIEQILENKEMTLLINKTLLIGYYLLNLGYMTVSILSWEAIDSKLEVINVVSERIGIIMVTLALIHYFNIAVIGLFGKYLINKTDSLCSISSE